MLRRKPSIRHFFASIFTEIYLLDKIFFILQQHFRLRNEIQKLNCLSLTLVPRADLFFNYISLIIIIRCRKCYFCWQHTLTWERFVCHHFWWINWRGCRRLSTPLLSNGTGQVWAVSLGLCKFWKWSFTLGSNAETHESESSFGAWTWRGVSLRFEDWTVQSFKFLSCTVRQSRYSFEV